MVGIVVLIFANIIILGATGTCGPEYGHGRVVPAVIGPLQKTVVHPVRWVQDVWERYFYLVSVAEENRRLKKALSCSIEKNNQVRELELANQRLRSLLNFKKTLRCRSIAAEIVGKDPSPWFKTVLIDKGTSDNVMPGLPVVSHEGIVGQVTESSAHYSKVLLLIDQNSAVDSLDQESRARGIVRGGEGGRFVFEYVLRKHDVSIDDIVVSSGLDGVFPKGIRVGKVADVAKGNSGIFQDVTVTPFVDFDKLEEVLVLFSESVTDPKDDS